MMLTFQFSLENVFLSKKKTKLEYGKILLVSICSLQEEKKLQTCIFFRREIKYSLSLSVSRCVFISTFSISKSLPPCYHFIFSTEWMILTQYDPPRIFTPTKLNFSILHCFKSSSRTEGSNTTWKPFILRQISTYKRT